ncbi:hypothetical protein [Rhodomicrobium sp. Az07]|nr:hypothetical protein [Rhodomicrobium sp. Az07]
MGSGVASGAAAETKNTRRIATAGAQVDVERDSNASSQDSDI